MEMTGDDEMSYGRGSESGGSSSSSDLEDIENELYSRIYYRSSETAAEAPAVINADASVSATVVDATTTIVSRSENTEEKDDVVIVSDDASEIVKEGDRSSRAYDGVGQQAGQPPGLRRAADTAAAAAVDLTLEVDHSTRRQFDLGTDFSPDEYVVLSSADEDDFANGSHVQRQQSSSLLAAPLSLLDSSQLTVESEDNASDVYEIDDSCDFEFNRLARTPRPTTTFGTLRDVLASLPQHGWHIIDADRYPEHFRSRYYDTRCKRCNERGHIVRDCRKEAKAPTCILCGMQGHVQWLCRQQLCINCGQFGHVLSTCSQKHRKLLYCQRCHRRGHLEEACSELWRQFHWASRPEAYESVLCKPSKPAAINKVRYCANCGLRGHFIHDCKALQPNPFRPAPSVFVNVYRNDSVRRGGTPSAISSRKTFIRDSAVSASAVRPSRQHTLADTSLFEADRRRGGGLLPVPTAVATVDESRRSSAVRKQKRRTCVERKARKKASINGSTGSVDASGRQSPVSADATLAAGDAGEEATAASAPVRREAAAELEAASSPAVPPWEEHESSFAMRQVASSPLKRPWLYDRSPAAMELQQAAGDLEGDFEPLPAKRRHLVDRHSAEVDRTELPVSKGSEKKKSRPAAKLRSRSPNTMEPRPMGKLQAGVKSPGNAAKSPGGEQPSGAHRPKPSKQQQQRQQQHRRQQQKRLRKHDEQWQQQQRQHQQKHKQQPLHQQQRPQQQQHWPHQQQQRPNQQQQRPNHQQQWPHQQHQQRPHQQQQQRQQQKQNIRAYTSGQRSPAAAREHYWAPQQWQQQQGQYWRAAEARRGGSSGRGRTPGSSHSYQVVKHGGFTGHYYRSGDEMVVKFDY